MIIDRLENLEKYVSLHPLFAQVLDYLKSAELETHEMGVEHLKDKELFVTFAEAAPKTEEEAPLETHNRYIDIQIPLSGEERMGYACRSDLSPAPYDEERDISFYRERPDTYLCVKPGMFVIFSLNERQFAIFFPEDAHAPAITPVTLRKVIVKVIA